MGLPGFGRPPPTGRRLRASYGPDPSVGFRPFRLRRIADLEWRIGHQPTNPVITGCVLSYG